MVFQQPNPFPMSIFDNVAYALREQALQAPGQAALEPPVVEALQRAGLYDEVGDDLDRPALRLSGGQQQRLCIARAIATRPEVLLMDEPCSALDPRSTAVIEELIGELRQELAIVIVTHNLQQAYRVGDRVAFMYLGDLVEYGPTEQVFGAPRAQRTRDYVAGCLRVMRAPPRPLLVARAGAARPARPRRTQERAARKARPRSVADQKGLTVTRRATRDVAVGATSVVRDANGIAAVVELRNTGARRAGAACRSRSR